MSKQPKNSFSELMRELELRGEAIAAQSAPAGQKVPQLCDLMDEGERRFSELLASHPENPPPDFDAIYQAKADLDRHLLGQGAPKRRWLRILFVVVTLVATAVGIGLRVWNWRYPGDLYNPVLGHQDHDF